MSVQHRSYKSAWHSGIHSVELYEEIVQFLLNECFEKMWEEPERWPSPKSDAHAFLTDPDLSGSIVCVCVCCLMGVQMHVYSCSADKEVCILQCAAAWQPGGQKHIVCLSIRPYALPRTQVKIPKKTVQGALCNVVTQYTVWQREERLWSYSI